MRSFLTHDLLISKYNLNEEDLPRNLQEALRCTNPMVRTIAMIVHGLEEIPPVTDTSLRNQVLQSLNSTK